MFYDYYTSPEQGFIVTGSFTLTVSVHYQSKHDLAAAAILVELLASTFAVFTRSATASSLSSYTDRFLLVKLGTVR
jgi:hypothetical protein